MFHPRQWLGSISRSYHILTAIIDRQRELKAAADLVADELERNRLQSANFHTDRISIQDVQAAISLGQLDAVQHVLHAISRDDPELWREIQNAYGCSS